MKSLLSKIYGFGVNNRNKAFDTGKKKIYRCVSPVISVGNLSVGGAGKTPFVEYLTKKLVEMKFKPAIVGRGYKRKSKGLVTISDGKNIFVNASVGGDEMLLLAEKCNVPVVAHDLKYKGALLTESMFDIDCLIVDDGFQHRNLFRDIDILLIDKETIDNPKLIPDGRLREPLSSIERADVICQMGDFIIPDDVFNEHFKNKYLLKVSSFPEKPYIINNNGKHISSKSVITFSGIAKPKNFQIMVSSLSYEVKDNIEFSDHHNYTEKDINLLINRAKYLNVNTLATTEKDMIKIKEFGKLFDSNNINVLIFPITLKFVEGEDKFEKLLKKVLSKSNEQKNKNRKN